MDRSERMQMQHRARSGLRIPALRWSLFVLVLGLVSSAVAGGDVTTPQPHSVCDESDLKRDAMGLLIAHFDVELGAVAPGDAQHVGFQHLKTADALFAAQAIAHDDFDRAAEQFRNVLKYQRGDGQLPHLVYGGSVPSDLAWLATNKTFYPGPAFWIKPANHSAPAKLLVTSSVLAPPIAADVAWQIFQLSPYETVLGVVGYKANALQFLCDAYAPLKQLQSLLLATRAAPNRSDLLLAAHHPWETFSSLSPHWISSLAALKTADDYARVTERIPAHAKTRFATGAQTLYANSSEAVHDIYEPLIYLASCVSKTLAEASESTPPRPPCGFQVYDTEFNALALRSAHALVRIARVLLDQSSVCTAFEQSRDELLTDVSALRAVEARLLLGILGDASRNSTGLWNATSQFFDDASTWSPTAVHSLRGVLPAYATANIPAPIAMGLLDHFLAPAETFHFFCANYPTSLFTCEPELGARPTTLPVYNYFVQRAFMNNDFPGLAEFVRNKTRDMVCAASAKSPTDGAVLALAYDSHDATPIGDFDDGFVGATLAAAALLNILLPAVAAPPSPDAPPVDHRILTVIMCIELVVAFVVALGCFLFSVYFVIKRPRDAATLRMTTTAGAGGRRTLGRVPSGRAKQLGRNDNDDDGDATPTTMRTPQQQRRVSDVRSSLEDRSLYSEFSDHDDLEEPLLSDDDDLVYGSFDAADREQQQQQSVGGAPTTSWRALKDALAAISPW